MKNIRKYVGVPTQEEITKQFNEISSLTEGIATFKQVKEFMSKYPNIEIEINGDSVEFYDNDGIDLIRFEYKNILAYLEVDGYDSKMSEYITLYSDTGLQFGDCKYCDYDKEIERVAKLGHLEVSVTKFKVVLHMVELEDGLSRGQICDLLDKLQDDDKGYMPLEISQNNSSAYGFICSSYFEELGYNAECISDIIEPVLSDWNNESADKIYKLKDGTEVYMDCDAVTVL